MNRTLRKWLVLTGLLGLAAVASADFNVQDRGSYYANAPSGQRTTSAGAQLTNEADPAMDANLTFENIIGPVSLASGAADSSIILDTHRMRLGTLLLKITPGTGVGTHTRLAVQIRTHLNAVDDSSSTFAIYSMFGKDQTAIGSAALDSLSGGHYVTGSASVMWSGEFVVAGARNRNEPNTGTPVAAVAFSYPNGIGIPLQSIYGRDFYAPYISVRIRNLVGPTAVVTAHLVGTPL